MALNFYIIDGACVFNSLDRPFCLCHVPFTGKKCEIEIKN